MAANTDKIQYNQLPRPTFRWMKVNYLELDRLPEQKGSAYRPEERHDGDVSVNFYDGNGIPDLGDFQGSNEEALESALHKANSGVAVTIGEHQKGTVHLKYSVSSDLPQLSAQLKIEAAPYSDVTVFLEFDGDADDGMVNFLTYVKTDEHARVKISKVQLNGRSVRHVEHRYGDAGKESTIDYVSAELGGKTAIVYYKTDLMTDESNFNSQAMYLSDDDQIVDFSYWVPTKGVKTNTDILTTAPSSTRRRNTSAGPSISCGAARRPSALNRISASFSVPRSIPFPYLSCSARKTTSSATMPPVPVRSTRTSCSTS